MGLFDDIELFARVVEHGSFTRAAEAMRLSRATVSERVRALEARVGARLFDRTTRRVAPTEAGRLFYTRCRRAIEEAQAGLDELAAEASEPAGVLRLGAPEGLSERCLVPALAPFLERHPRLSLELMEEQRAVNLVEAGLDLAVRVAQKPDPALIVRRLGTSRVAICAAPNYLAEAGTPTDPRDLPRHRTVGFKPLIWAREWRFRGPDGDLAVAVQPAILCTTTGALRAAALSGIGIVALPTWAVHAELREGRLVQLLDNWKTAPSGIYAVYPSNRLIASRVRACVDHLAKYLAQRLPAEP